MKSRSLLSRRASRGQKLLLAAPVFAGAAVPGSQAAIIFTNVNGGSGLTTPTTSHQIFFNVEAGTYHLGPSAPGDEFQLSFYGASDRLRVSYVPPYTVGVDITGGSYANKLNTAALISSSSTFFTGAFMAYKGYGPWVSGGNGYLGLKMGSNYGWANVTYNVNGSLTLYGFAYDNTGAPILAGQTVVPEPAETALLGALVAGSAVAFAARRKRKLAKAA